MSRIRNQKPRPDGTGGAEIAPAGTVPRGTAPVEIGRAGTSKAGEHKAL